MLVSFRKQFVFIANLKTASSSIERTLRKYSEVAVRKTEHGKHMYASQAKTIVDSFPLPNKIKEGLFWFGVIREPVSYLLSIYNSHQKDAFDGMKHSTKGVSFDEFIEAWCLKDMNWQVRPQSKRFFDDSGKLMIDYLIPYEKLAEGIAKVWDKLEIDDELPHSNKSPNVISEDDVSNEMRAVITSLYEDDYRLYEKALHEL